jgi:hypothetical protein
LAAKSTDRRGTVARLTTIVPICDDIVMTRRDGQVPAVALLAAVDADNTRDEEMLDGPHSPQQPGR